MYFPEGLENTPFILAALGGVPPLVTISQSLIVFNPVRGHKRASTGNEIVIIESDLACRQKYDVSALLYIKVIDTM